MKKIALWILALAVLCTLVLSATASDDPTATVTTDATAYEAGEIITVTVTLNNGVSEDDGVTGFQHVLHYDKAYLEYVEKSAVTSADYKTLGGYKVSTSHSANKSQVKCNWINSDTEPTEMPEGVMFTVKFVALEDVSDKLVKTLLTLSCDFFDESSVTVHALSAEAEVVICPDHVSGAVVKENVVDPDCTNAGHYDNACYCTLCGAQVSRETVTVPALGHSYDGGKVVTAPACEKDGLRIYACFCGETKSEVLPATGHTTGEAKIENKKAGSCTVPGSHDEVYDCVACGKEISRTTVQSYHKGDMVTVTVTLDQTVNGATLLQGVLSYDGAYLECVSVVTSHAYDFLTTVISSRDTQVKFNWNSSVSEGRTFTAGEVIEVTFVALQDVTQEQLEASVNTIIDVQNSKGDAVADLEGKVDSAVWPGHSWDDGVYTKPTCTADGYTTYSCACGETKTEPDEGTMTGHTAGDPVEENYTVSSAGCYYEEVVYCVVCGGEISRTKVSFGILGDVNFDGEVDIKDANLVCSYYNEILDLTDAALTVADVNGDEEVDIKDANLICSYYNEVIWKFPVEE